LTGPRIGSIIKYKSWMEKRYFFVVSSEFNKDRYEDYPDTYSVRLLDIDNGREVHLTALPKPFREYAQGQVLYSNSFAWDYVD
jgi:hypothetical protein